MESSNQKSETAAPTAKLKKGLSKVFKRKDKDKDSDSDGEMESVADDVSGVGEAEEALDGHLFSVGVAFAQVTWLLLLSRLNLWRLLVYLVALPVWSLDCHHRQLAHVSFYQRYALWLVYCQHCAIAEGLQPQ